MSENSGMPHLIIGRESGFLTHFFDIFIQRIRFFCDQSTAIDINNLTELSLFMKSEIPVRMDILSLRNIFPETKLDLISVSRLQWRGDDRQYIDSIKFPDTIFY